MSGDKDKQDLEDSGLDQDVQVLGGIILQPKYAFIVFKSYFRTRVEGRKRYKNATVWTEIILKMAKKKLRF